MSDKQRPSYLDAKRHVLLDMHVPDWDPGLLAKFDPEVMGRMYRSAGAEAVMLYCNSHVGLCYWPTKVGAVHAGIGDRDLVGEVVERAHRDGMAACAYYSLNFNNWAHREHPEWRLVPADPDQLFVEPSSKYGICCPNNPDLHAFERAQVRELAGAYEFDAFFFDMLFWPSICICDACRQRWLDESGGDLPRTVDWFAPDWCRFQATRERWLTERYDDFVADIKAQLEIPVFLNGALTMSGWLYGLGADLLGRNDLLGGDPAGAGESALAYSLLLAGLAPGRFQFMYPFTGYIGGAGYLRDVEEQTLRYAQPLTALGGQYMAIDSVEPGGAVNPAAYEDVLAEVFANMGGYGAPPAGPPVADVNVYCSLASQVDFADNGQTLAEASFGASFEPGTLPHSKAVEGVVASVRAELPVAVITRRNLDRLGECPLVVLPNVMRMDDAEVEAIREYVRAGGRLIASGYTSLVDIGGQLHGDFRLADVFGCHFERIDDAAIGYARPLHPSLREAIAPVLVVPFAGEPATIRPSLSSGLSIEVTPAAGAEVLAVLTRPFGEGRGGKEDREWASIHSSPPFLATEQPVIVRNRFGAGEAIYIGADLDARATSPGSARQLMVALVREMLPRPPAFEVSGDPGIWLVGHELPGNGKRLSILNHPDCLPARRSGSLTVRLAGPEPPERIESLPGRASVAFELDADGRARFELDGIDSLEVFEVFSRRSTA